MRTQKRTKSRVGKIKKKVLKKVNFLNLSIAGLCLLAGYMVVALSSATQSYPPKKGAVENITESVNRIADSFELYNQKKFNTQ